MNIPKGHQTLVPYLVIDGALKFSDFLKEVFTAEETIMSLNDDSKTVSHAEMMLNGSLLMFSEANQGWKAQPGNLCIYVENADETFKKALGAGADVVIPVSDQEYGRSGGVRDPFGNTWWVTSLNN